MKETSAVLIAEMATHGSGCSGDWHIEIGGPVLLALAVLLSRMMIVPSESSRRRGKRK